MLLKLETLKYQEKAINAVIKAFDGNIKNTFDNSTIEGIRGNFSDLTLDEFQENIKMTSFDNGLDEKIANLQPERELTIEMETGTGKTLVYLKTIYELFQKYQFAKFIILVPSVAIREGILASFQNFAPQLEEIYGFTPHLFEYDSKKLSKVAGFIEEQHPQIMVMTIASFNSEDKILNQAQREDLFNNIPYIDAIGKTNPIVIMDEPQEGMDTENSVKQIAKLNPLVKLRYSATHKIIKNLIYRLTPYDSYKQGLVKKIEVLTVTEKNDEASLKIEIADVDNKSTPKIKLKIWIQAASGKIEFKPTSWLKDGDNLGEKANNPSYLNYKIERIFKSLKTGKWTVAFSNGVEITEKQIAGNIESIWAMQLEWLIYRHFTKANVLREKNIKCLSLIFIDKVVNYVGETPIIKNLFEEKYKKIFKEFNGSEPSSEHLLSIQGYYFAQNSKGEFADNEGGIKQQKEIYDAILRDKEEILRFGDSTANKIEFIFSHSALGVGWDNPNVFNIATLSSAYSEIRKRQEIGRGLRIAVNTDGKRIYDNEQTPDNERVNQLTVIPNETYETFVTQYQEEIKSLYGSTEAGAGMTNTHKGEQKDKVFFKRNTTDSIDKAFRRFWKAMAKKTDYIVYFDEEKLIAEAVQKINTIEIPDYVIEASSHLLHQISEAGKKDTYLGGESIKQKAIFTPLDIIEELSENTGMSYITLFKIVTQLKNLNQLIKNPPRFIHEASVILKNTELDEMLRSITYETNGETYEFDFNDFEKNIDPTKYVETPNKGVFDKMLIDSLPERNFSLDADKDTEVVCFLKLPSYYKIKTPIGDYEPDFGLVLKRKQLKDGAEQEYYFVIETKGTNSIDDKKALSESEIYKIKCALQHFKAIGIDVHYKAPIKEFSYFKKEAEITMNNK